MRPDTANGAETEAARPDRRAERREEAWQAAARVVDPEIPVISIADLGILRELDLAADGSVQVTITPTYSGCPAMQAIEEDLNRSLLAAGFAHVTVRTVLAPAWTTDWITAEGRAALSKYGIAPPSSAAGSVRLTLSVRCPLCGSLDTRETSRFSSTACKSLWRCNGCKEPFDHFKVF